MTVLVTGANGFVGRWVVRALLAAGHSVVGAAGPDVAQAGGLEEEERRQVQWAQLDLLDADSIRAVAAGGYDAVVHLAGVASGHDATRNPGMTWTVNAEGTARLLGELGRRRAAGETDPVVLVVSTAEVYGPASHPLRETDPVAPRSPYATSKRGAELAASETAARTGLRVVLARPVGHTGPGQDARFVAPAFAERLRAAKRAGSRCVTVGNLEVTREFLDVRDVADAYLRLLDRGASGEVYNVASGQGITLRELFDRLAGIVGVDAQPETDPTLVRGADIAYLVGDPAKLRAATGWTPTRALDTTLRDLVHAQAN